MGDKTGIEWTDSTWNPIRGCSRVSEGCRNCYAETVANRFKGEGQPYHGLIAKGGQWNGKVVEIDDLIDQPLRWRRPRRIFVNSMSDLFHKNVPDDTIDRIFAVMSVAEWHTFQILTKRPERMRAYLSQNRRSEWAGWAVNLWGGGDPDALHDAIMDGPTVLPNVWVGVSVEDQSALDERLPLLLDTPAAVRWISAEPLIGPIDLSCWPIYGPDREQLLSWIVVGGESGPGARPMHPAWARSLRDQCATAGVPFLFKQWGEWALDGEGKHDAWVAADGRGHVDAYGDEAEKLMADAVDGKTGTRWLLMNKAGKKAAGRRLDGVQHDGYPGARS